MPGLLRSPIGSVTPPEPTTSGDRLYGWSCVFPSSMRIENGGRIIDVTTSIPFITNNAKVNAVGNGVADDSDAFIAAFDYVLARLSLFPRNNDNTNYVIYMPGSAAAPKTYRVTKEITWTGSTDEGENSQYWRLYGEDRRYCTIRLANGSTGYGAAATKPVLNLAKASINALETKSSLKNFTLSTGSGNPGAVGIKWGGANANVIDSVTIKSEDPGLAGKYGIDLQNVHQYWIHDFTVEGFNIGLRATYQRSTSDTIEWCTFRNQIQAGLVLVDNSYFMRKVLSENTVPAVRNDGSRGFIFVVDCDFRGGASANAAIQMTSGSQAHVRDTRTTGYGSAVKIGSTVQQAGPNVSEWTSTASFTLWGTGHPTALRLPIEDSPTLAGWPAVGSWSVISGNTGIQTVFNSGVPGIMFRNFVHSIGTINVPASVKMIFGAHTTLSGTLNVVENSADPLIIVAVNGANVTSANGITRAVVTQEGAQLEYQTQNPATGFKLFLNCISGVGTMTVNGATVFARMINTEPKNITSCFTWSNSRVWMLGYKTESDSASHRVTNGGHLEILGGFSNQTPFDNIQSTMLSVIDSKCSASILTTGHNNGLGYRYAVEATKNGVTRRLDFGDAVVRGPVADHNCYLPLYVDNLVDEAASLPWLVGVNLAGAEFGESNLPGTEGNDFLWPTSQEVTYYASRGFNLARIPFRGERWEANTNGYRTKLLAVIDLCLAAGMYVMPDMHNYWRWYSNNITQTNYVAQWTAIVGTLGSRENLILNLMNEPNGISASTVVTGNNAVINAIRNAGYDGWIAVSGTAWSGAHSWESSGNAAAFANATRDDKVVIDMHQYLNSDSSDSNICITGSASRANDAILWARANNWKILLGECSWNSAESTCLTEGPGLLQNLANNKDVCRGFSYWANFPWAYRSAEDGSTQRLEPWLSNPSADRPQIATLQSFME